MMKKLKRMIFPDHAFTLNNTIFQNEEPELGKYDFAYDKPVKAEIVAEIFLCLYFRIYVDSSSFKFV